MENKNSPSESFIRFFEAALPAGLAAAVRDNLRAAASSAFDKMDLVSNEEFEVQKRVLLRTREKLEQLELQVAELEKKMRQ
ncbi:MAG: accessory factor UbiK family protein [Gammaproteobacteria bacterium]|nr:accessory factor UbiK family protein [Gammaproteobacteria bacterium]